jgi:hypothetical protein
MCLFCHRSQVFSTMQLELKQRGSEGDDYAALCRQEAWQFERRAKQTDDPKSKAALMETVIELRKWADEEDGDALAGAEPVPLVDRSGVEK